MDKDTILDYVTETPGNTNRAVLGDMLDSFAGGGGSSDFTTAEVTIVGVENLTASGISAPIVVDMEGYGTVLLSQAAPELISLYNPLTVVILKNGITGVSIFVKPGYETSVSGDATCEGGSAVSVTGDCTITVS